MALLEVREFSFSRSLALETQFLVSDHETQIGFARRFGSQYAAREFHVAESLLPFFESIIDLGNSTIILPSEVALIMKIKALAGRSKGVPITLPFVILYQIG